MHCSNIGNNENLVLCKMLATFWSTRAACIHSYSYLTLTVTTILNIAYN